MTEELKNQIQSKHPTAKLSVVTLPATDFDGEVEIVIKRPSRGEYKRFRSMLFDDGLKQDALETLARNCVAYPEPEGFSALLEERPGIAETIGGKLVDLAGLEKTVAAKKL